MVSRRPTDSNIQPHTQTHNDNKQSIDDNAAS